ncbi:protein kinase domain protein [Ichthyophthirius multifiliis]|uniref:Protein kinase domain protein n=1 Tax=Ichthyophthirius multifiliis TaxID=5932 RepID=G0R033_ICHMU|nr:protein kinase domain protein [Ichthyophthirius multifiliis]EGR29173.1 protein kinase domain protein [Ichthyophthirius multifiliis]|eukprot:XP_004030409.1 protein kinase domain protein [Ichthyophthirius multifiliis]
MSPQALSSDNYDLEKNDVWSAGVLLYEMVFQKIPWKVDHNENDQQLSLQQLINVIIQNEINFEYLIKLMLDQDEESRVDWDDINNKGIIVNSFDETIRQEIFSVLDIEGSQTLNLDQMVEIFKKYNIQLEKNDLNKLYKVGKNQEKYEKYLKLITLDDLNTRISEKLRLSNTPFVIENFVISLLTEINNHHNN